MKAKFIGIILLLILSFPFLAVAQEEKESLADWTPFQLSLWNPVQLFGEQRDVYGLRLNILYGKNRDVYGLDLGIGNRSHNIYGIQVGYVNLFDGNVWGIQIGGANLRGWFESEIKTNDVTGIQIGGVNEAHDLTGFQLGAVNIAERVKGVQIGVVNYCKQMTGIQIGGINVITEGALPFFLGINASTSF